MTKGLYIIKMVVFSMMEKSLKIIYMEKENIYMKMDDIKYLIMKKVVKEYYIIKMVALNMMVIFLMVFTMEMENILMKMGNIILANGSMIILKVKEYFIIKMEI